MAHTHYHPDNAVADTGTIALVVLLLGVLIIGLIAYRTLWASQPTLQVPTTASSVTTSSSTTAL